jgi:succinate dehydrogenase / fumarate reductase flavoprotein subunit
VGEHETHEFDVLVIGAGGAGLRAAVEAHARGANAAIVCKSLLGKAHTVMAEGGVAAALGTVYPDDNWQVHFRDTMRGGKMLNNWRMAQIHAQEAPERVYELEEWGAVWDRTADGRILQRDFGGHRFARLAHVGDRTGLELIRTMQQKAVSERIEVFMECTVLRLLQDADGRAAGAVAYRRESGAFLVLKARAVVLATGGIGKAFRITSNSWEYTGDGHALALWAGADLIDMEFVQFHPTGMVWPPSVRGILVTEGVRGDGGVLKNRDGERFMFRYVPDMFRAETAETEEEADRWYDDKSVRRTPDLLPRDEVARAINSEIKAGRGTEHGGVFLDIASRRSPEYIKRKLPGMYHQFRQLADVDITSEPMEIGPTCHYMMGGVRVDPETAAATVPGVFAAGEVAAGLHGSNRLGGNSLSDLLVFGRRGGIGAAEHAAGLEGQPSVDDAEVDRITTEALEPFGRDRGENPYSIHRDLEDCMHNLVGIIRTEAELKQALDEIATFRERAANVAIEGHRQFNPGWHLALDLGPMLAVSEAITRAALERKESRGGHTRDDFPGTDPEFSKVNVRVREEDGALVIDHVPLPEMPDDLKVLFEEKK